MTVQGIDLSQWQGGAAFDWHQWAGRIGFAMAKATEGDSETDPDFGTYWDSMWWIHADHRLPRFAYSYFHASQDPIVQAAHLVATVKGQGLAMGDNFVLDLEETEAGTGRNDGERHAATARAAYECLKEVNRLAPGHRVLLYCNPSFAEAGNCAELYPWYLWLADYGVPAPTAPAPWDRATLWQYTDDPIDGDRFMGTNDQLLAFTRMPDKR